MMYDLGFTASYTEVLRFRSSVAIYTGEKHLEYESLSPDRWLVSAWFDNYNLNVYTPNGKRETHAMAIEFIQHTLPTVVQDQNVKLPVIPRLTKVQVASLKLSEISPVEYLHHVGPKNPKSSKITNHQGQHFEDLMQQHTSLNKAVQLDFKWLVGLHKSDFSGELACEWSGYMKPLPREDNSIGQPTQSTTSYRGAVSHRWAYLSTCSWGMECCLRRTIQRANIHSVWQIEGRSRGHQFLC